MTERGLPIVDGAPACPFVAFDDDRDERATSPDHRHRCYAEAQPASRALAHQEAYCLSSAFPVCPTFQDWARREAARARASEPPLTDFEDDLPPLVSDRPPRRDSRDVWAAPPPWLRGQAPGGGPDDASAVPPAAAAAAGAAGGGLAGSFADRLTSERGASPPPPVPEEDAAPSGQAPVPDERAAPRPATWSGPEEDGARDADDEPMPPSPRRRERMDLAHEHEDAERERDGRAPAWERPRRLEAYPTLRSRRLTSAALPPILLGIAALLLAALALFFLPSILGLLSAPGSSPPAPSSTAAAQPSASLPASLAPAATPLLYTVQPGDTFTKIAKRFGVSLADLIAANRATHPNPDVLAVGDTLIIPTAGSSALPGASGGAPAASG